jgi:hypothetical protein
MPSTFDDRRDSQRVPFRFLVRARAPDGPFVEHEGNLAMGGVYFTGSDPPEGTSVELRFTVPGHDHEVTATGQVLRVGGPAERFGAHIRFTEIPLDCELALARYFQSHTAQKP